MGQFQQLQQRDDSCRRAELAKSQLYWAADFAVKAYFQYLCDHCCGSTMTDQTGAHAQFPLDSVRPAIPCKMMVRAMLPSASPPISTNNHLTVSAHLTHFEENFFKDQTEVISPETLYKCFMCTLSERIVEDIVIKTQTILTMWNSTKNSQNMAKIHVEHYYLARAILLRDYGSLGISHTPSTIYELIRSKMSLPSLQSGTTHDPLHQIVQQCVRMGELDRKALKQVLDMAMFTMPPLRLLYMGSIHPNRRLYEAKQSRASLPTRSSLDL